MSQLDDTVKNASDRQCWAVRCPAGQSAVRGAGGACTCTEGGSTLATGGRGMPNHCELAYCTGGDNAATAATETTKSGGGWFNGVCACGAPTGGSGTGVLSGLGGGPKLPMVLTPPPSFSQQNPRPETFGFQSDRP